jgi:hypothetical protein
MRDNCTNSSSNNSNNNSRDIGRTKTSGTKMWEEMIGVGF